jgi:PST family polysaccharide transporter
MARYPAKIGVRVHGERLRELMRVGGGQTVAQIAGVLATYGDNFVVGRVLGAKELGYYTRAYDMIKLPSLVFQNIVGNVLFPALSKFQDDRSRLATNFRRLTFINALVLLPGSAALIVLGPETIRLLMGPGWSAAVLPFRILTITMLMRTTQKLGAIVATAAGRVNAIAIAFVAYTVMVIGGASIAIRAGIVGVAITTSISIFVVSTICSIVALDVSKLPARELVRAHLHGLVLAGLVLAVFWPATMAMRGHVSYALVFATVLVGSIALCALVVGLWVYRGRGDFEWLRTELKRLRPLLAQRRLLRR